MTRSSVVENTISLLSPFIAFIPANEIGCSGVLAVVAMGLFLGRGGPRIITAETRLQATAMWEVLTFLLEGLIFIFIGLQLPQVIRALDAGAVERLVAVSVAITAAMIVTRIFWMFPGAACILCKVGLSGFPKSCAGYFRRVSGRCSNERRFSTTPIILTWSLAEDLSPAEEQEGYGLIGRRRRMSIAEYPSRRSPRTLPEVTEPKIKGSALWVAHALMSAGHAGASDRDATASLQERQAAYLRRAAPVARAWLANQQRQWPGRGG